jgi:hypothetical protein
VTMNNLVCLHTSCYTCTSIHQIPTWVLPRGVAGDVRTANRQAVQSTRPAMNEPLSYAWCSHFYLCNSREGACLCQRGTIKSIRTTHLGAPKGWCCMRSYSQPPGSAKYAPAMRAAPTPCGQRHRQDILTVAGGCLHFELTARQCTVPSCHKSGSHTLQPATSALRIPQAFATAYCRTSSRVKSGAKVVQSMTGNSQRGSLDDQSRGFGNCFCCVCFVQLQ